MLLGLARYNEVHQHTRKRDGQPLTRGDVGVGCPMRAATDGNVTQLLDAVHHGEPGAVDALSAAIYDDLRVMARKHLARDFGPGMAGATIQPTILVNDTIMKLIRQRQRFDNAGHFFAIATKVMIRVLMDYHRARKAAKRGGDHDGVRVSLDPDQPQSHATGGVDVEMVERALTKLAALDARKADVVRYRVYWGMTVPQIAQALAVGDATIERDWSFAKAFLGKELAGLQS